MQQNIDVIAPGLISGTQYSETELLGSAVWLWSHSDTHKGAPLSILKTVIFPPISHKQCAIFFHNKQLVGYVSWAMMNEEAEERYLTHPSRFLEPGDWTSGDRRWVIDWIAPFGHSFDIVRLLTHRVAAKEWGRFLYHRGREKGFKIKTFCGAAVMKQEADHWFNTHPPKLGGRQ